MDTAENCNAGCCRPQAAGSEPDDVVDDAAHVCLLYPVISQRIGSVLVDFKYY